MRTIKITLLAASIIVISGTIANSQTTPNDSTTKAYIIIWDRNTESDVEYYNIWLIQPITPGDSTNADNWTYMRIGEAMQPQFEIDSVTFQVQTVNNSSVIFAFTVTAVDHVGNQSGYASAEQDTSRHRTRWIYGLPPSAPTGLRVVTVILPDSVILMIMQGQMIETEMIMQIIQKNQGVK